MPTGAVIAEQSVHLLPVEPVLGAPQNASHAEVQIVLRKNMYDWGVSMGLLPMGNSCCFRGAQTELWSLKARANSSLTTPFVTWPAMSS